MMKIEDDVAGQQIEEVLPVSESRQALFDDPEERVQGAEVVHVLDHMTVFQLPHTAGGPVTDTRVVGQQTDCVSAGRTSPSHDSEAVALLLGRRYTQVCA